MTSVKLQAARELIVGDHFDAARSVLETMPASNTARKWLNRLGEIAPPTDNAMTKWEYLEVYVKTSDRLPADINAVIEDRPFTTVDHFYTRMLNQYGAEGWELVAEELQGGDFYRLLFKRRKQD